MHRVLRQHECRTAATKTICQSTGGYFLHIWNSRLDEIRKALVDPDSSVPKAVLQCIDGIWEAKNMGISAKSLSFMLILVAIDRVQSLSHLRAPCLGLPLLLCPLGVSRGTFQHQHFWSFHLLFLARRFYAKAEGGDTPNMVGASTGSKVSTRHRRLHLLRSFFW